MTIAMVRWTNCTVAMLWTKFIHHGSIIRISGGIQFPSMSGKVLYA